MFAALLDPQLHSYCGAPARCITEVAASGHTKSRGTNASASELLLVRCESGWGKI